MKTRYILGVNTSHDASACLFRENTLVSAIEEERLNKDKHSLSLKISNRQRLVKVLPSLSIAYVLAAKGITIDELDKIYINDCDLFGCDSILTAQEYLRGLLPIKDKTKITFVPPSQHQLLHAYTAYYLSGFKECLILVVDAYVSGDENRNRAFESIFYAWGNKVSEVYVRQAFRGEMGIGALYQFFCKLLNFDSRLTGEINNNYFGLGHDEAGKLMGLASYGRPVFKESIVKKRNSELSIKIRDLYEFGLRYNLVKKIKNPQLFDALEMNTAQKLLAPSRVLDNYRSPLVQNLAYFAQRQLELALTILVERAQKMKTTKNLCLSGGIALNCLANARIKQKFRHTSLFVPFAPADSGNAIGLCFYSYAQEQKSHSKSVFYNCSPFTGRRYKIDAKKIIQAARYSGLNINEETFFIQRLPRGALSKKISDILNNNFVIALIRGAAEFGPRALGHRSILASPFKQETKDYLNLFIKKREWFRPFAPVVPASYRNTYLKTYGIGHSYMSYALPLKKSFFRLLAVKNADNSCRAQIFRQKENRVLSQVIKEFGRKTGIYALLNTSCNLRGWPIIEHPLEIFGLYNRIPVDAIVIENWLIIPRYDTFKILVKFNKDKLALTELENLAIRLYQSQNYFRAQVLFKKLFQMTKNKAYLIGRFKSLLFLPKTKEIGVLFNLLKKHRIDFLTNRYAKTTALEYRIYLGLFEVLFKHLEAYSLIFGNWLIRKIRQEKGSDTAVQVATDILRIFSLPGGEELLLRLRAGKAHAIQRLVLALLAKCPEMVNNSILQQLL
jgi:carbamoyltransferase